MTASPFQRDCLHTMGGALLGTIGGLRKLKGLLEKKSLDPDGTSVCLEQVAKIELAVDRVSTAFAELHRDLSEGGDKIKIEATRPKILITDSSRAALAQIMNRLNQEGLSAQILSSQAEEWDRDSDAAAVVIGLDSALTHSLEICQELRGKKWGQSLPLILLTAGESANSLLDFIPLGIAAFCPRSLALRDLAGLAKNAIHQFSSSSGQIPLVSRSALAELAISSILRQAQRLDDLQTTGLSPEAVEIERTRIRSEYEFLGQDIARWIADTTHLKAIA